MACSKRGVTGRTVLLVSTSVLSLLKIPFCISSRFQIKQERFGTIRMTVSSPTAIYKFTLMKSFKKRPSTAMGSKDRLLSMTQKILTETCESNAEMTDVDVADGPLGIGMILTTV
jgi:hypothetical protein